MSPYVSPRMVADRRSRARKAMAGIAAELAFAIALLGTGYLICALASRL